MQFYPDCYKELIYKQSSTKNVQNSFCKPRKDSHSFILSVFIKSSRKFIHKNFKNDSTETNLTFHELGGIHSRLFMICMDFTKTSYKTFSRKVLPGIIILTAQRLYRKMYGSRDLLYMYYNYSNVIVFGGEQKAQSRAMHTSYLAVQRLP